MCIFIIKRILDLSIDRQEYDVNIFQWTKRWKKYTIYVNYIREEDDVLITSYRNHAWWKNLIRDVSGTFKIKREEAEGIGEVIIIKTEVSEYLRTYL